MAKRMWNAHFDGTIVVEGEDLDRAKAIQRISVALADLEALAARHIDDSIHNSIAITISDEDNVQEVP